MVLLTNGNYVIANSAFGGLSGAITFANGNTGTTGILSDSNSLVGFQNDQLGTVYVPPPFPGDPSPPPSPAVVPLPNGDYLVTCPAWDLNLGTLDVGAVARASGTTGLTGNLSSANALTGTQAYDRVGQRVFALSNSNYVVASEFWNGPGIQRGAVTFAGGGTAMIGTVTAANSLIGTTDYQNLGEFGVTPLGSGGYAVYDRTLQAVAFGTPASGVLGTISSSNALLGTTNGGDLRVTPLSNGHYVVSGQNAVAWGSGILGVTGSLANPAIAMLGNANYTLFSNDVEALSNGRYIVGTSSYDQGANSNVGALLNLSGTSSFTGTISNTNAQVGITAEDRLSLPVFEQSNGKLVVMASSWDHNGATDVGGTFLMRNDGTSVGAPLVADVVVGVTPNSGNNHEFAYDTVRNQLLVGQPTDRRIIALRPGTLSITTIQAESIDPSSDNQPVPFTATVAAGSLPNSGRVIFRSSNGETCTDTTPTTVNSFTVEFGCSITFTVGGASQVWAEYVGSEQFAYSRSANEGHTTNLSTIFKNSFE